MTTRRVLTMAASLMAASGLPAVDLYAPARRKARAPDPARQAAAEAKRARKAAKLAADHNRHRSEQKDAP